MKRSKCLITAILVLMSAASVPAGCSLYHEMTGPGQTAEISGQDVPVRLEWLAGPNPGMDEEAPVVKAVEDRFHIDLKIWELASDGFWDSANDCFERGELPDVLVLDNINQLPGYVDMGIIAELPVEVISEKAPAYAQAVDSEEDGTFWKTMTYKGKNYGVANPMDAVPTVMVWRKDWLDRLGLSVPETLEEYEKVLTAFVKEDPDGNGENDTSAMAERSFGAVFGAYGLRCYTGSGSSFRVGELQLGRGGVPFFPYIRPEAGAVLSILHKWYGRGIIDREFITGENHGGYKWLSHSFMYGKIGLTCAPPNEYLIAGTDTADQKNWGPCMKELKRINPKADIVFGPPPKGPEGKSGTECGGTAGHLTCLTTKGASDPRKADAFLAMLEAYYDDMDFAKLVNYGLEGIHYKNTPKGPVRLMEEKELKKEGVLCVDFGDTVNFAEQVKPLETKFAHEAAGVGDCYFNAPAVKELSDAGTTLTGLTDQAYFDMITGVKPIGYFNTFAEEFKKKGGSAAEKAVQQAYADRLASAS